jgi:hypothetical protein
VRSSTGAILDNPGDNGAETRVSRPDPDDDGTVEESPEQVLARLVRYADRLNGAGSVGAAPNGDAEATVTAPPVLRLRTPGPDARAAAWGGAQDAATEGVSAPQREWRYSPDSMWRQTRAAVPATVFGQFLAVLACTLAVVAFEQFDATVAVELVAAGALVGVLAAARRVPLALWWTFGVLLGGVLGRWS